MKGNTESVCVWNATGGVTRTAPHVAGETPVWVFFSARHEFPNYHCDENNYSDRITPSSHFIDLVLFDHEALHKTGSNMPHVGMLKRDSGNLP